MSNKRKPQSSSSSSAKRRAREKKQKLGQLVSAMRLEDDGTARK